MDIERKTFLLCFTTIIWRRIFCTMLVYNDEKKSYENNLLKCLKYNLLAPNGIVNILKPYIIKCLKNKFLMPNEYRCNETVKNAINLFGSIYKILKRDINVEREITKYIINYASRIEENKGAEMIDCIRDIHDNESLNNISEIIDVWDIDLTLVPTDPYIDLISYFLFNYLKFD